MLEGVVNQAAEKVCAKSCGKNAITNRPYVQQPVTLLTYKRLGWGGNEGKVGSPRGIPANNTVVTWDPGVGDPVVSTWLGL